MNTRYDCLIAGGGPAGASAAATLARLGRSVLLLEAKADGQLQIGESLPPAITPCLRQLSFLNVLESTGAQPSLGNSSAWGEEELQYTDFIFNPHGHGWHIDRPRFNTALRTCARTAGAEIQTSVRVIELQRTSDAWSATLQPIGASNVPQSVTAKSLIDATGRHCSLARLLGAQRRRDDSLIAYFARFTSPKLTRAPADCDSYTLIEAVADGWWYTARVPPAGRMVAFLTDADLADPADLLTPEGFSKKLKATTHIRDRVHAHCYTLSGRPLGTDSGSSRLFPAFGENWIAAGDAAQSYDPLSSQGVISALNAGSKAAQALHEALRGSADALAAFDAEQAAHYDNYLEQKRGYYSMEYRWKQEQFWQRRHK
jgi:flavin-dependent dehydrogenase